MCRALVVFLLSLFLPQLVGAATLRSGEKIPVGTADGRGPLATYGVVSQPLGSAILSHEREADLFIRTTKFGEVTGLFLYPFSDRNKEGIPVFGKGIEIKYPFEGHFPPSGDIFQTEDGAVHGCWIQGKEIVYTVYSPKEHAFEEVHRVTIDGLPRPARNLTLLPNSDGNWRVVLDVSDGSPYRPPGPGGRDPEYNPYDGRGIWRGELPYGGLYGATLRQDFSALVEPAQLISSTTREVLDTYFHLTSGPLKKGGVPVVIGGSRMGEISTYPPSAEDPKRLAKRRYIVGKDGNALRHPTILPSPVVYSDPQSGLTDLMVGGEGGIYYYKFTGQYSESGNPVFEKPVPALQEDADLYAGSLPVPNFVDWDHDNDLDMITGNSEGFVLFLENAGSNETRKYLNAVRLKAGGHTIHVQPGYRLDIQGPFESRWGYTCPAVADWNEDGLLDILMSDSTARHHVYLNIGSASQPESGSSSPDLSRRPRTSWNLEGQTGSGEDGRANGLCGLGR